jgi:hypothetical protein
MRTQLHPKTALQYLHISFIVMSIVLAIHYIIIIIVVVVVVVVFVVIIIIIIYSHSIDPNSVTESWVWKSSKGKKIIKYLNT